MAERDGRRLGGSPPLRISLLGGFRIRVGPRTIEEDEWRLRKAAGVIKLLALVPEHRLHRERITDLFWPKLSSGSAANNLRFALHHVRRMLEPNLVTASSYLRVQNEQVALAPVSRLLVDVDAFEEAAAIARRARTPAAYRAAVDLYAGDLLPDDVYEDWVEDRREGLRNLYLALLKEMAGLYEEQEEFGAAAEAFGKVVEREPRDEEAHVGLMRLYALSERRSEAIRQYERLLEVLHRDLAAEPSAASKHIYQEIQAGRVPHSLSSQAAGTTREAESLGAHDLPASRTSFIGREREVVEVRRALAICTSLTLTGAGGTGKTRLAVEVARNLIGAYPEGVWFADLAPLRDSEHVAKTVAWVLGVGEQQNRTPIDTLTDALRERKLLIVLDNCEHVVDGAARLVDALLDSCQRLRILATSREALGVEGEVIWPVQPLSVPDAEYSLSVEEIERSESVRLFMDRARQRLPTLEATPANVRAVAEVCRRLEGIPLAIELAAARMGTLSLEQISQRLSDSLKLLTGGSRTKLPRQRTLRGALDWSHELLFEEEKEFFARLSVFAGGWTLEAAEAVGPGEVLDLLSGLVEKSLVVARGSDQGSMRYRMLEPIRQYAWEKLEEGGEGDETRRQHATFFLSLAEEAKPKLRGPQDTEWLELLEAEHDNLRAVLSWALGRGEIEMGLRLAGALWVFWDAHGHLIEGRSWLEAVLAKDDRTSVSARLKALEALGWLMYDHTDLDRAEAVAQEAMELSAEAEIDSSLAASLRIVLAGPVWVGGDYERGKKLLKESLAISREADDKVMIADVLFQLAITMHRQDDTAERKEFYEEGIALCRELGYTYRLPGFLLSLGYESILEGDYERGAALNEEAAALCRERGYKSFLNYALDNLGWAALLQGDLERARSFYEESLTLCKELADRNIASESLEGLACIAGTRGEAGRAAILFGAAATLREAVGVQIIPERYALREPYLAIARPRLGDVAWEEAWAEGRKMSMEQAVVYAFSEEEPAPKQPSAGVSSDLTRREEEVAVLVARGLTNRQIAERLVLSEHTVITHVRNILKKLELTSRVQLAAWMVERRPLP